MATPNDSSPLIVTAGTEVPEDAAATPGRRRSVMGLGLAGLSVFGAAYVYRTQYDSTATAQFNVPETAKYEALATTNWTNLVDTVTTGGETGAYAYTSEVRYAQCWTATCTLNGDGLTASCGCLSLPPSDEYPAKLKFGWSSSIMAKSGAYQKAIASAAAGDDFDTYNDIIVSAIKDKSIYSAYGFDTPPDLISMNSKSSELGDFGMKKCTNSEGINAVQCMAAPCWNTEYNGVWNTTCVCTYTTAYDAIVKDTYSDECDVASTTGAGCGIIGYVSSVLDDAGLENMIKTVESATMTIDTTTCPTQDTDVETSMFASYTAPAPAKNRKPSLDDVKAEKATKASSKTTIANKSSKGEKADELKDEKATKASSKATKASMTTKGKEADNLKNEKATKASSKATKANISQKGTKAGDIKASHAGQ